MNCESLNNKYKKMMETVKNNTLSIYELMNNCSEMVANIQLANDTREIKRRDMEEKKKKIRTLFLEKETTMARIQLEKIHSKWNNISKFNDSVNIYHACENQKCSFMELIQRKNHIINNLKKELEKVDEDFTENQLEQRNDINVLSNRIDDHLEIMKEAYRKHLNLTEETMKQKQKILLHKKQKEWSELNKMFIQKEQEILNYTFSIVENHEKIISDIISDYCEKYRSTKNKLDNQLQILYIELEEVKTMCFLNEKKLEYNYLVITKRREELEKIKVKQRLRINNLQDILNETEMKKQESKELHKSRVAKLTKSILELKLNLKSLLKKLLRIDRVNDNIFRKIWKFNEKRVQVFLKKILNYDKMIYEKTLFLKWEIVHLCFPQIFELPSVQTALHLVSLNDFEQTNEFLEMEKQQEQFIVEENIFSNVSNDFHLTKFILHKISQTIKFIINDNIDSLTENLIEEKRLLVNFDNTMKILKITNEEELNCLKQLFFKFVDCITCKNEKKKVTNKNDELPTIVTSSKYKYQSTLMKRTGSGNKLLCKKRMFTKRPTSAKENKRIDTLELYDNKTKIDFCMNPEHLWFLDEYTVIKILSVFMNDRKQRKKEAKNATKTTKTLQKILLSRILSSKDIELYWNVFQPPVIKEKCGFWKIITSNLSNYYKLLQDLSMNQLKVQCIKRQNSELKRVLHNFSTKITNMEENFH